MPCLTTTAIFLWLLGYPDRSLERADRLAALLRENPPPSDADDK